MDDTNFSYAVDNWPPSAYMNVYTCGISNGYAGFSSAPDGTAAKDNIVMSYEWVGEDYLDKGAILAHEVGHWLGLPHTFNGNSCSKDDGLVVNDTPNTDQASTNYISSLGYSERELCDPSFDVSVVNRCGEPVMYTNNMDYALGTCRKYFTKGQASEMRGYLESSTSPPFVAVFPCSSRTM